MSISLRGLKFSKVSLVKTLSVAMVFSASFAAEAFAQRFGSEGSFVPIVDQPGKNEVVDGSTFGAKLLPNHSYLCLTEILRGEGDNPVVFLNTDVTTPSGATLVGGRATSASEVDRYFSYIMGPWRLSGGSASVRQALFVSAADGSEEKGTYTFSLGVTTDDSVSAEIVCMDTTVICEYNTVVNDFNFLEASSFGKIDLAFSVRAQSSTGKETSFSTTPAIVPALSRTDVDIHSLVGAGDFGTLFVQPLNFLPVIDGMGTSKLTTYKSGELTSSIACQQVSSGNSGLKGISSR